MQPPSTLENINLKNRTIFQFKKYVDLLVSTKSSLQYLCLSSQPVPQYPIPLSRLVLS